MENYSCSTYPDSRDSSPRSREVDNENSSLDEIPSNNNNSSNSGAYKVKFMCSYGGKIQPRAHDNLLAYVGGDTKILAVDRNIKFSALMAKLSSLSSADVCFKYQLPGEDLDALISVANEEDLEHLMVEYDRLCRASARPARLRLFLFPLNASAPANFGLNELKPERQWFVDALNSVQIPPLEGSSPPAPVPAANPDFLFGLDKGYPGVPAAKLPDSAPAPTIPDIAAKDLPKGSECGSEDRQVVGEPVVSPADVQRQIQELQRLQLGNNEQLLQRKSDEGNGRVYNMEYYSQKNPETVAPSTAHAHAHSGPVPVPVPVSVQASAAAFLPERHMTNGGYSLAVSATGTEPPVYLIQTPSGVYQAVRPMTAPVGQAYYAVPRMVPAAEVYNAAPQASLSHSHSQPKIAYNGAEVGAVSEHGYSQVAYLPDMSTMLRQHPVVTAGTDGRQVSGALFESGA